MLEPPPPQYLKIDSRSLYLGRRLTQKLERWRESGVVCFQIA